jgi:hypothetical protein
VLGYPASHEGGKLTADQNGRNRYCQDIPGDFRPLHCTHAQVRESGRDGSGGDDEVRIPGSHTDGHSAKHLFHCTHFSG